MTPTGLANMLKRQGTVTSEGRYQHIRDPAPTIALTSTETSHGKQS